MYAYAIGQCGIKVAEFWRLTEAETIGIIVGNQKAKSYDSENYRNLYGLLASKFGIKGDVRNMWKLPTDGSNAVSQEYLDTRNKAAVEIAKGLGIFPLN